MTETEIVAEYEERLGAAEKYRGLAALFLVLAVIALAGYGVYQNRAADWNGVLLLAGLALLLLALAFSLLSFLKLRCPNCSRVLGELFGAAYCPHCGAALRPGNRTGMEIPNRADQPSASLATRRRPRGGAWEPKASLATVADFPDEAYPKNIRMFTTSNELELTKRYIKLIDRDNSAEDDLPMTNRASGAGRKKAAPAARPENGSAKRPAWRPEAGENSTPEASGWLSRLVNRIRRA